MAVSSHTTPSGVTEPASRFFTHSAISRGFSQLLAALAGYIEAERDISDAGSFDPAFDIWARDAEAARARVLALTGAIHRAAVVRTEDRPLRRMAMICALMIEADSLDAFVDAYSIPIESPLLFSCDGAGATGWRVAQMLRTCSLRLGELTTLPTHVDPWEVDDVTDAPDTAMESVPA